MLWFLVQLALFLTPIAGLAVMLASNGFGRSEIDTDTAIPIAGVCFAFSPLFVAVLLGEWVRFGRPRSRGYLVHALLILVCGGLTVALMTAGSDRIGGWGLWSVPVWVAVASAVLLLALVTVSSDSAARGRRRAPEHPLDVASLTPGEVIELLEVREQTLRTLADRDLVDARLVERAREVPLGELHTLDRTSSGGDVRA